MVQYNKCSIFMLQSSENKPHIIDIHFYFVQFSYPICKLGKEEGKMIIY